MFGMMIGMATAASTVFERRTALGVALALVGLTVGAMPVAGVQLPAVNAFLPIYSTLACGGDALTAFLLFGQARANRLPTLNVLAFAYCYSAFVIVAQVLVFPGILSPAGLLGATTQTAIWFWVWWHGGFPLLVTAYVAGEALQARRRPLHVRALGPAAGVVVLALAVALLLWFTVRADGRLPALIVKGNYHALVTTGVGPGVVVLLLGALGVLGFYTRLRTVTGIWLAVALLAMLLDVTLTLIAGGRYTVGWYVARIESLIAAFVVLLSFLGAISRMYEQLARIATLDGLTGTYNRRAFDEQLVAARSASLRAKIPLSIVMLDVDHFKRFNDRYGHVAGDDCLRTIAAVAKGELTRRTDALARYGGEEFAIVLLGTDLTGAVRVAERVRGAIAALGIRNDSAAGHTVTASLGVFGFDPRSDEMLSCSDFVRRADRALYTAKQTGRNRVVAFGDRTMEREAG